MGKFERMRDRLPSLYRPDDDDSAGQVVPLRAADLAAVVLDPPLEVKLADANGTVLVLLPQAARLREVRLAPGTAPGVSYALEFFPYSGARLPELPAAAAPVRDGVAAPTLAFSSARFLIQLKRNSHLTLYLRAVDAVLQAADNSAAEALQAHWFDYADRARFSPFYLRGRELRGWPAPRPVPGALHDAGALATRLKADSEPLTQHINTQLPAELSAQIAAYTGGVAPRALSSALSDALEVLVEAGPLFSEVRFEGVTLSPDARRMLGQNPTGRELVQLNWLLLEEAYPDAIARSVLEFPYIADLGRLAALLAISPWREPPALREAVEPFRLRIARTVALYRAGLGTLGAIRRMVEASLPIDASRPDERRDRGFWIEESAPLVARGHAVQARGEPADLVGPMMRWTMRSDALAAALPVVYIRGVTPDAGVIDPTERPLVELFDGGAGQPPLGLAYAGNLAPDQALRLRPSFSSWLAQDAVLRRAEALPGVVEPADPTAAGPWRNVPGAPAGPIVALHQSYDRALWALTGAGELWRFDGLAWAIAVDGLAAPRALAEAADGRTLYLATGDGLRSVELYPPGAFSAEPVADLDGVAVLALARDAAGTIWAGTANGARAVGVAGPPDLGGAEVHALSFDAGGARYYATNRGLIQVQPGTGDRYRYEGQGRSEQARDWLPLGALPAPGEDFLPQVRCLHRGPDGSLWIGTEHGLARYVARAAGGLVYETLLEAFPDLGAEPVHTIRVDERGLVWIGGERGLLRYDGRDLWQLRGDTWAQLGRADTLYDDTLGLQPRGAWRYDRGTDAWQRFDERTRVWEAPALALRATDEPAVRAIAWSDGVTADLGSWDGTQFTPGGAPVNPADLRMRVKPSPERALAGGIPAVPRLPAGSSTWRYLSLEPAGFVPPDGTPFWTMEGRLIPPPQMEPPDSGRYDVDVPPPPSDYDATIFAYNPAARVWFAWHERRALAAIVRLTLREPGEVIDPIVLDRVWEGIAQVRPAGIRVALAVAEQLVRS